MRTFTREAGAWANTAEGHWKPFVEQAFLYPESKQGQDLFATAVAIDGEVAVVGAPNRDSFVSYVNGGAAFAYDLDFLRLKFSEEPYLVRCHRPCRHPIRVPLGPFPRDCSLQLGTTSTVLLS